jgi:hypothetical protein
MRLEVDPSLVSNIVKEYTKKSIIKGFHAKHYSKKGLKEWMAYHWVKFLGYNPNLTMVSRGYNTFLFQSDINGKNVLNEDHSFRGYLGSCLNEHCDLL